MPVNMDNFSFFDSVLDDLPSQHIYPILLVLCSQIGHFFYFTTLNLQPMLPIIVHFLENEVAHEFHLPGQLHKTYISSFGHRY